ncbi:MAG TPA: fumarylacetoacetate hydrolase family protein, partial [Enteractinococcus sp.]
QDFSERTVQQRPPAAQFGLGKSFPGFGPFGPAVVTPDEVGDDAGNLQVKCVITGPTAESQGVDAWTAQDGNTQDMIFPVAELVAHLANILTLYPGDIIFTGTPKGIGQPQGIFLQPGDVVTTSIEGLGELQNTMV